MKWIFALLIVTFPMPVWSAEFLVLANDGGGGSKGDILEVRPDGWAWGDNESLPTFLIVKIPNVTLAQVSKYETNLMDTTNPNSPVMKYLCAYQLPPSIMKTLLNMNNSVITVSAGQATNYINQIIHKL